MYQKIAYLGIVLYVLAFLSCNRGLEDIPASQESVNGFDIVWRKNVNTDKKQVICMLLNNMQYVKGGVFLMGATQEQSPYARYNEYPAHYVKLSDYYICNLEITSEQVEILMDKKFDFLERNKFGWEDWNRLINLLCEYSQIHFDFPTEAQWEYAARGGLNSNGYIFPGANNIEKASIFKNELGLMDMAKGHSEWCKDVYAPYNNVSLEIDPCNVQGIGHVVRGGNVASVDTISGYNSQSSIMKKDYTYDNEFYDVYQDYRTCRVSARSYSDDKQVYLNANITCRLVINP